MTLLQLESNRIVAHFDKLWQAWQQQHHISYSLPANRVAYRQFPLALYDLFPDVPFQDARHISLAAKAAEWYFLINQAPELNGTDRQKQETVAWLYSLIIEQLQATIPATAQFWAIFQDSDEVCRQAFQKEANYLSTLTVPYTEDKFVSVTDEQTILVQLIIRAFATLAAENKQLSSALNSQSHFYVGLRLFEHVLCWKEDFVSGTFSYPLLNLLVKQAAVEPAPTSKERQEQLTQVGQYFYYTGLAEQTLAHASENFYRAMASVTELGSNFWGVTIGQFLEQSENLRKDIGSIRRKQVAQLVVSPQLPTERADEIAVTMHLPAAIENGVNYLIREQHPDGYWGDFMLRGEQSTAWVTGYVGWVLQQLVPQHLCLEPATNWLIANRTSTGWGYNSNWPDDVDTVANVLLFLASNEKIEPAVWQPLLTMLVNLQANDGGFCTKIDVDDWMVRFYSPTVGFRGWASSHPCVTAVVALLLATLDDKRYERQVRQVQAYLHRQQHDDGYWHAYWWAGNYYTTCRAVQALKSIGAQSDQVRLDKVADWLLKSQSADGGWGIRSEAGGQSFHTAFAVQTLACTASTQEQKAALLAGVKWLLSHQKSDGSWPVSPVLRVPDPDMLCPWAFANWRESIFGVNVVVPDWHRLFTTATVLQALQQSAVWGEHWGAETMAQVHK